MRTTCPHQRAFHFQIFVYSSLFPDRYKTEHCFLGHSNSGSGVFATIAISWFQWAEIFEMFNHLNLFIIHCNSCIGLHLPIFRRLVFVTCNSSNLAFPILLNFPISLSASSCEFAQMRCRLRISDLSHLSWYPFPQSASRITCHNGGGKVKHIIYVNNKNVL